MIRRGADELVDVGIAAHDPVHDDDVVRLDLRGDEVLDPPLDATLERCAPRSAPPAASS